MQGHCSSVYGKRNANCFCAALLHLKEWHTIGCKHWAAICSSWESNSSVLIGGMSQVLLWLYGETWLFMIPYSVWHLCWSDKCRHNPLTWYFFNTTHKSISCCLPKYVKLVLHFITNWCILFCRYSQTEIETKVAAYRNMLVDNDGSKPTALPRDEFGRVA